VKNDVTLREWGREDGVSHRMNLRRRTFTAVRTPFADRGDLVGTSTATLQVVLTAHGLCALVWRFTSKPGIATSLCAKLDNSPPHAFISEVRAQRGKSISAGDADILMALGRQL
jgi:hypothetical protein